MTYVATDSEILTASKRDKRYSIHYIKTSNNCITFILSVNYDCIRYSGETEIFFRSYDKLTPVSITNVC
jgi:hypothetical protein